MNSITPPDSSSTWARRGPYPQSPLCLVLESITQPTPCPYLGLSHSMTFSPSIFLPLTFYKEVLTKTLEFFPLSIQMRHLGPRLAEHIILTRTALSTVLPGTYGCTRIPCIPKVWPLGFFTLWCQNRDPSPLWAENFLRERPGPPPLAGPVSRASPGMQEFLSPPHHLLNTNKNNEWWGICIRPQTGNHVSSTESNSQNEYRHSQVLMTCPCLWK